MRNLAADTLTRKISCANWTLLRRGERILLGSVPVTLLQVPKHRKWILVQEDPEVKPVRKTRKEVLRDILMRKTSRGIVDKRELDPVSYKKGEIFVPRAQMLVEEEKFITIARKPKKVFYVAIKRDAEKRRAALAEFKGDTKGVRERYDTILNPRVSAAVAEADKKARELLKRRILRRRREGKPALPATGI